MRVEIVSIQAALAGRESIVWTGEVSEGFRAATDAETNDRLFRCFNRVDDEDGPRLDEIGYRLPSLSVGDLLHWDSTTWRVAGLGFERITGSGEYVTALALYALKSAADAPEDYSDVWERVRENDKREFDESGKARVTDPNEPQ